MQHLSYSPSQHDLGDTKGRDLTSSRFLTAEFALHSPFSSFSVANLRASQCWKMFLLGFSSVVPSPASEQTHGTHSSPVGWEVASSPSPECKPSSINSPVSVIRETKQIAGKGILYLTLVSSLMVFCIYSSVTLRRAAWTKPTSLVQDEPNFVLCPQPLPPKLYLVLQKQWPWWKKKVKFRWQKMGVRQTSSRDLSSKWDKSRYSPKQSHTLKEKEHGFSTALWKWALEITTSPCTNHSTT